MEKLTIQAVDSTAGLARWAFLVGQEAAAKDCENDASGALATVEFSPWVNDNEYGLAKCRKLVELAFSNGWLDWNGLVH